MLINFKTLELEFEFTFTISRSSKNTTQTIILELEHNGYKGLGEAVFSRFYGESDESVINFYSKLNQSQILEDIDIFNIQLIDNLIDEFEKKNFPTQKNQSAKAGLDIALYDLRAKILNMPLYKYLGLDPAKAPKSSYTIGIADLDTIKMKTLTALERGYDILKVKLGSNEDIKIVETIRRLAPQALIRVDANAAWDVNAALEVLKVIKDYDIEFVEEPLKLESSKADYQKLYELSPLPLMADESIHTLTDIPNAAKYFHSINLKHTKTGGLTESIRMIHAARAHNLKIMLGCFTETSVSISAFAHISPLVDYADLDGALLLKNDPYRNDLFKANQIVLSNRAGLGIIN